MRLARDLKGIIPALEENTEVLSFEYPKDWRNEDYLIQDGITLKTEMRNIARFVLKGRMDS